MELIQCFSSNNDNENEKENKKYFYYHCNNKHVLFDSKIIEIECPFSGLNIYELWYK